MKRLISMLVLACVCLGLGVVTSSAQCVWPTGEVIDVSPLSDAQLISAFTSRDGDRATAAILEIMRRDAGMVKRLAPLRGDKERFCGRGLVDIRHSTAYPMYLDGRFDPVSYVPNEMAALYMISAVYSESRWFGSYILREADKPRRHLEEGYILERAEYIQRVERAWNATSRWLDRYDQIGIEELRRLGEHPLTGSGAKFD